MDKHTNNNMIQIPSADKNFIQSNTGTSIGNVVGSFNLDFYTNRGKVRVYPRTFQNITTTDVSALNGVPIAFKVFNSKWYAIAGQGSGTKGIFYNTGLNPSAAFVVSTETSVPTTIQSSVSDAEIMYSTSGSAVDKLYVSGNDGKVYYLPSGSTTWASLSIGNASAAYPHMLCTFIGRMYVSDNQFNILSFDAAHAIATLGNPYTLSLKTPSQAGNTINWMRVAQDSIFIGTVNQRDGKCYVYVWDGINPTGANKIVKIDAMAALSCVVKNDIPYIMDSNGYLLKYNGTSFVEVARLPLPAGIVLYGSDNSNNSRAVHPNGMAIVRGKINILVNANMPLIQEYCPSGVWEYEEDASTNGLPSYSGHLYHKSSASLTPGSVNTSDSITDFGQWNLPLGDTGVTPNSGGVGALVEANTTAGQSTNNGNILFGSQYFSSASTPTATSNYAIYTNDTNNTTDKIGYFITPEMYASRDNKNTFVESLWDTIFLRYRKFLNNATYSQFSNKLVAYYRTVTDIPTDYTGTWTTNNTFTISGDITALYAVGDTAEVLQGAGSGLTATIASIAYSAPNTTVFVSFGTNPQATTTMKVRLSKWQLIGTTLATTNLVNVKNQFIKMGLPINANDTRIQIKLMFQFSGNDEFEQMILLEKPQTTAT